MQRCGCCIWAKLLHDLGEASSVVRHDIETHLERGSRHFDPVRRYTDGVTCSIPFLQAKHLFVFDWILQRRPVSVSFGSGGGVGRIHLVFREHVGADPLRGGTREVEIVVDLRALNVLGAVEDLIRGVTFVVAQDDVILGEKFGGDLATDAEVEGFHALGAECVDLVAFE